MIFKLSDDNYDFPNPYFGEPGGLFAIGGDLSVGRLIEAYHRGIFPWYSFRSEWGPQWYCPLERFVIFPDEIHISHSMRTLMNKKRYRLSVNENFDGVIRGCGKVDDRDQIEGAWLGDEIIVAYTKLYELGIAMSVEVWEDERLVGGLYGERINNCFIGESMFSLVPSASKLALIHLAKLYQPLPHSFIDCQNETPHLKSMGGRYLSYRKYLEILNTEGEGPFPPQHFSK